MKSKITLSILIIVIIFLGILSFFFGYKYLDEKNSVNELNTQIEELKNANKQNGESSKPSEIAENTIEKLAIAKIDTSKVEIDDGYTYTGSFDFDERNGIQVIIGESKSINFRSFEEAWKFFNNEGEYIDYTIENLDKTPIEVSISGNGEYLKAYFLMEDGTVRYITGPSIMAKETTLKEVEGLSDVVTLRKIVVQRINGGGNIVTIAVKSDGTSKVLI